VLATLLTSPAGTGQEPLIIVGAVVAYLVAVAMSPPPSEPGAAETGDAATRRTAPPADGRATVRERPA